MKRVGVFGSYLSNQTRLGDIDLAIELAPKQTDKKLHESLSVQRINEALSQGRVFGNLVQRIYWPQEAVWLFLKARSRSYSLHSFQDPEFLQAKLKIIYPPDQAEICVPLPS